MSTVTLIQYFLVVPKLSKHNLFFLLDSEVYIVTNLPYIKMSNLTFSADGKICINSMTCHKYLLYL
jgi:hypothetical protein